MGNWFGNGKFKLGVQKVIFDALKVNQESRPLGETVRDNKEIIVKYYEKQLGLNTLESPSWIYRSDMLIYVTVNESSQALSKPFDINMLQFLFKGKYVTVQNKCE